MEKYHIGLDNAEWQTSTRSGDSNCIRVAFLDGYVAITDSKNPYPKGPAFIVTPEEWDAFIGVDGEPGGVKGGQFDI